ncbi:MAG: hypothetical protein HYX47_10065 [Burkholderiales bacterium]|nr:hypothetical protein [Burkholderiales bacterium]
MSLFTLALLAGLAGHAAAAEKTHCTPKEKVVWSCSGATKAYSLCASEDLGASQGYLQYRAGPFGQPDFVYPAVRRHPRGYFTYESANRVAFLRFKNQQYVYELGDALLNPSWIIVTKGSSQVANFQCRNSTQSLNDTDSIDLFNTVGISEQPR